MCVYHSYFLALSWFSLTLAYDHYPFTPVQGPWLTLLHFSSLFFFFLIISVVLALESLTLHSTAESDSPLVLNFNNEIQLLPAREEWVYTYYLKLY